MFAPPIVKPRTKSAEPQFAAIVPQRHIQSEVGGLQVKYASLTRNELRAPENEDNAARGTGLEAAPSWAFSKIPVFPSGRAERFQMPPYLPAPRLLCPIQATSAGNETALPTGQTDAGPPTPPRRVPSPPAPPPPAPSASRCTISSRTLDTAPDGTADRRTVVGVNEIVFMTASVPSTWSATAGTINATDASGAWLSPASSDKPVSCSVTATPVTGSPCSINFRVIPPSERKMTKKTDRAYTAGLAGSGFDATALILPLNVSFSGIKVREETVAGEATGYYKTVLGWNKGMHPTGAWNRVDAKNNNVKDTIGTDPPGTRGPFGIGTFFWPIPLTWRTPDGTKAYPYGTADQMQVMLDSSGAEITSKEGAERARTP